MKRILLIAILGLLACPPNASAQQSARKLVKRGIELFSKGDIAGAIVEYNRALTIDPKLADAYLNRGKARRAGGDLDGAITDYETVCDLDPQMAVNNHDITEAYFNRGRAFLIEGNSKFAIADFDKSISLDDRNPLVYAERGLAHQTQGHAGEAQKDFERGLKLNNDLRLMLDLHLLDLQIQIKEMRRRQAAIQRNIAGLTLDSPPGAGFPRRAAAV